MFPSWGFFPASAAADFAAVIPTGVNTLVGNRVSTFFIIGRPTFIRGPRSLRRNQPDCSILYIFVFDYSIWADEWFIRALQRLHTCLFVSDNLWGKLNDNLKVTSVLFLYESDNFTFTLLYWVILYYIKTKTRNYNAFTVPREKIFTALWQFREKLYLQFTILWKKSKIIF